MTAPTVESITETQFSSNPTAHACNLPATVNAGDLLILTISFDNGTVTVSSGPGGDWEELWEGQGGAPGNPRGACYILDAAGTEGGGTATVTTSGGVNAAAQVHRILAANWFGDTAGVEAEIEIGAGGSTPDPPSITTSWNDDTLYMVQTCCRDDDATVSSYPSGYDDNQTDTVSSGGTNDGATVGTATKEGTGGSAEDPGTFTLSQSEDHVTNTIAIRQNTGAGSGSGTGTPPVVDSITETSVTGNPTTHNYDLPATVAANDLLILTLSLETGASTIDTSPSGWTELWEGQGGAPGNPRGACYALKAAGTEGGGQASIEISAGCNSAGQVHRILAANWFKDLLGVEAGTPSGDASDSPDPPSITPSWEDGTLYIAQACARNDDATVSTYPSGFDDNQTDTVTGAAAGGTDGATVGTASTTTTDGSTVDPGTFTLSETEDWVSNVIVIRASQSTLIVLRRRRQFVGAF